MCKKGKYKIDTSFSPRLARGAHAVFTAEIFFCPTRSERVGDNVRALAQVHFPEETFETLLGSMVARQRRG